MSKVNLQPKFIVNPLLVVHSNFERFLTSVYKFDMVYTLVYGCPDWRMFRTELTFLKKIIRKNGYSENFIVFKSF